MKTFQLPFTALFLGIFQFLFFSIAVPGGYAAELTPNAAPTREVAVQPDNQQAEPVVTPVSLEPEISQLPQGTPGAETPTLSAAVVDLTPVPADKKPPVNPAVADPPKTSVGFNLTPVEKKKFEDDLKKIDVEVKGSIVFEKLEIMLNNGNYNLNKWIPDNENMVAVDGDLYAKAGDDSGDLYMKFSGVDLANLLAYLKTVPKDLISPMLTKFLGGLKLGGTLQDWKDKLMPLPQPDRGVGTVYLHFKKR